MTGTSFLKEPGTGDAPPRRRRRSRLVVHPRRGREGTGGGGLASLAHLWKLWGSAECRVPLCLNRRASLACCTWNTRADPPPDATLQRDKEGKGQGPVLCGTIERLMTHLTQVALVIPYFCL
jgi:hypothetical protein